MVKEKSAKETALLSLIQAPTKPSKAAEASALAAAPDHKSLSPRSGANQQRRKEDPLKGSRGKRVTIYLHEGDRRIIRELIAYLAGQGRRGLSESSTIKAALRVAKPGADLLNAHEAATSQDQRFKRTA